MSPVSHKNAFLPVIASHSPFPMSSHLVDFRLLSKNLSSVMACVPMLILLPLLRSNVSRESDGTGLSLTWRGGGEEGRRGGGEEGRRGG